MNCAVVRTTLVVLVHLYLTNTDLLDALCCCEDYSGGSCTFISQIQICWMHCAVVKAT